MRLHFVTVPIHGSAEAEAELNQFLATHRVIAVDRQLVSDGPRSAWAICITYVEPGAGAGLDAGGKKGRVDYREVLPEAEFQVFAKLRDLRKRLAEREGVPPYANHPGNRNDDLGFRLAREQEWVGRPAPDPTCAASGSLGAGEIQAGAGVEVAAADAPSNPRRWPTFACGARR